jgi:hypothetical protein
VLRSVEGSAARAPIERPVPWVTQPAADAAPAPPRTTLLTAGVATLGLAYGLSAAVAASSAHGPDRWLYAPLVGPYVDLAAPDSCGSSAARPCYREAGNKLLLATDGILQTVGTAAIVFAALTPGHGPGERSARVQVGLVQMGRGRPALAAFGRF